MNIQEGRYIIKAKRLITNLSNKEEQILFIKDKEYKAERGDNIWFVVDELNESNAFSNHNIQGWRLTDFDDYFEIIKENDSVEENEDIVIIERNNCANMINVKIKDDEFVWCLDDGIDTIASDIRDLLDQFGIKSQITDC